MNISEIIWLEDIVDKLKWKHNVEEYEVIEILNDKPLFQFIEKGHRRDENVYAALGQTNSERYLTVFFVFKKIKQALIISVKDMTKKERKWYGRR